MVVNFFKVLKSIRFKTGVVDFEGHKFSCNLILI